jgi:Putative zinc-finger
MKRQAIECHYTKMGRNAMDHAEAIQTKAVESYLLGEMSGSARQAFEEHFFDCPECAKDLHMTTAFIHASKEVFRTELAQRMNPVKTRFAWKTRNSYALAASVIFAMVLLYENLVTIPGLRKSATPQALESFSLVSSRSSAPNVIVPSGTKPFVMLFDIPPDANYSDYHCEILSETGENAASFDVPTLLAQRTIPLFIPASKLKPGKYSLVAWGGPQQAGNANEEVVRYQFEVR